MRTVSRRESSTTGRGKLDPQRLSIFDWIGTVWYHLWPELTRRRSSAAEQGTHKPLAGGSIPPVGTIEQPMTSARSEREPTTAIQRRRLAFSGIEQRLLRRWRDEGPTRGSVIAVAFSGGPDSLCLAAALGRIAPRFDVRVCLIHVDHGLRPGSALEALHARTLADLLGLQIEIARIPDGLVDRHPGVGVEEAARRERYSLLQQCAATLGTDLVATGHHLDDQAETVMLHLLRGAGLTGAAAMRYWSELTVPWWMHGDGERLRIWRPLLAEPKTALRAYVNQLGLRPNCDETNEESVFTRNAVRHRLMPAVDACASNGRTALARFAEIAGEEDRFLAEIATQAASEVIDGSGKLFVRATLQLPTAIRRRVLASWLGRVLPCGDEGTLERIVALDAFLHTEPGGKLLEIGGGYVATRSADKLVAGSRWDIEETSWTSFGGPRPLEQDELPCSLRIGEMRSFTGFRVSLVPQNTEIAHDSPGPPTLVRACDAPEPLVIRNVERGDRYASGVSVTRWLSNRGVPVHLRHQVVCISGACGVVWVPGVELPGASVPLAEEEILIGRWSGAE